MPDMFTVAEDPEKLRQEAHGAATSTAKAISDCFYKVDSLLSKIPEAAPAKSQLKAIRDALFIQKNKAEGIVQQATMSPVPEEAPAPANVPSKAAQLIYAKFQGGEAARVGSLETDGYTITFQGNPIFKKQNRRLYASWGGYPTAKVAKLINALSTLAGLESRVDADHARREKHASSQGWTYLGNDTSSLPPKLVRK